MMCRYTYTNICCLLHQLLFFFFYICVFFFIIACLELCRSFIAVLDSFPPTTPLVSSISELLFNVKLFYVSTFLVSSIWKVFQICWLHEHFNKNSGMFPCYYYDYYFELEFVINWVNILCVIRISVEDSSYILQYMWICFVGTSSSLS